MIEAAIQEATRRRMSNVRFEVAAAEHLPFASNFFDAVVSRFGVMFFPDPLLGIREMLRVLKPDRRFAFAVWHAAEGNPFHTVVNDTLERYIESTPAAPDAPGGYRFAEPGKLLRLLKEAEVQHPTERLLRFHTQAPISIEQYWDLRIELSDTLRAKVAKLAPNQVAQAKRDVINEAKTFWVEGAMNFPSEVLIVSGRKAGVR